MVGTMTILKKFIAAGAFSLIAGMASASSVYTAETCRVTDVMDQASTSYASACYGAVFEGTTGHGSDGINDSTRLLNEGRFYASLQDWMDGEAGGGSFTTGLFGQTDWVSLARVEGEGTSGGLMIEYGASGDYDGTWSYAGALYEEMVLVLKQGATFTAYLFEDGIFEDGLWSTTELAFGDNEGGLSHATIYGRGALLSTVPLPAAGFLLLGGLAGLGLMRRRKS
jgi:hypothetical protein